ncbi:methyl-accepting chemotaxis protein [Veronia pacifica]|uniref:Chemotaxis protein n=1 Tax=Veronia pacifica TaxID=1080227 RepID=A0A1C3E7G9_9GAMM|nr:methyl-accepting chemotaxis protein [Veronia pacifica]ODA29207.1 chemotaxis protein [Veronia pacifica]
MMATRFADFALVKKITILLCFVGLIPSGITAVIGLYSATTSLESQKTQSINAIASLKADSLQQYFGQSITVLQNLAKSPITVAAAPEFIQTYNSYPVDDKQYQTVPTQLLDYYQNQFGPVYTEKTGQSAPVEFMLESVETKTLALQKAYIADNIFPLGEKDKLSSAGKERYDFVHRRYHEAFRNYIVDFGFYDIFIVDINTGNLVYSVYKELDYATNLVNGPYSESGIGQAFQRMKRDVEAGQKDPVFVDYEPYLPSYSAPASFISTPVYMGTEPVAVLIIQLPLDQVSQVMSKANGLGITGESYLVGSDRKLRSDTFFSDKYTVEGSFRQNLTINTQLIDNALQGADVGRNTSLESKNYLGDDTLSIYNAVDIAAGTTWYVVVEQKTSEALAAIRDLQLIYILLTIILLGSILFVAARFGRYVSKPVQDLSTCLLTLQQNWRFSIRAAVHSNDETGQAAKALNATLASLENAVKSISATMNRFAEGDFKQRVELNLEGDLELLKKKINDSASVIDETIEDIGNVMSEVQKGQFDKRVTVDAKGQLALVKEQVNQSSIKTADFISDARRVMEQLESGQYDQRVESHASGELAELKESINQSIANSEAIIIQICSVMEAMSKGDFSQTVTVEASGKLKEMKESVNSASGSTNTVINSILSVMGAIVEGDFKTRSNAKAQGELLKLASAVNDTGEKLEETFSHTQDIMQSLSKGDLTQNFILDVSGDYRQLKNNTNQTIGNLSGMIQEIQGTAFTVNDKTDEASSEVSGLNQQLEEQLQSIQSISQLMETMRSSINETLSKAKFSSSLSQDALSNAIQGKAVIEDIEKAMNAITQSSKQMQQIISVIDGIAFQTNLLALNAAVEAARAGEQGRGFSVVASEVRALAQRSSDAAKEISTLINESDKRISLGVNQVSESGKLLKKITDSNNDVCSNFEQVNEAIQDQFRQVESVSEDVRSVDDNIKLCAQIITRLQGNMGDVSSQADGLTELIKRFKY